MIATAPPKSETDMPNATDPPPMQEASCPFCERRVLVYEDPPRCPLCDCPLEGDRMRPFTFPPVAPPRAEA